MRLAYDWSTMDRRRGLVGLLALWRTARRGVQVIATTAAFMFACGGGNAVTIPTPGAAPTGPASPRTAEPGGDGGSLVSGALLSVGDLASGWRSVPTDGFGIINEVCGRHVEYAG